jgi:hypothetical protein
VGIEVVKQQDQIYRSQTSTELHNAEISKKENDEHFVQVTKQEHRSEVHDSTVVKLSSQSEADPDAHQKSEQELKKLQKKLQKTDEVIEAPKRYFNAGGGDHIDYIV